MASILRIYRRPRFADATMVIGMAGWMNGGDVSTATVQYFINTLDADELGEIDSEGFYIYNFPGSMETSSLFRPQAKIKDGLVKEYDPPSSNFYYSSKRRLIFLFGKEPHIAWETYVDCVFAVCKRFNVSRIYFAGSIAGLTPHTREPTISFTASDEHIRDQLRELGLRPSNYEGPASIVTLLTVRAAEEKIKMATLVAEIPAYVDGYNPRCIETMTRCVARLLNLTLDLNDLKTASKEFEKKLSSLVKSQPDLADKIKELETDYDRNAFSRSMTDLNGWLEQQGIKVE